MKHRPLFLICFGLIGHGTFICAEYIDEEAARQYFEGVPKVSATETPPLAVASTVGAGLFGPSTVGERIGYYLFDSQHLIEIDLDTEEVRKVPLPVKRKSRSIYEQGVASAQVGPDGQIYFALRGGPAWFGRFDPATRKIATLGELAGYTPAHWIWHTDGYLYIVTYPAMLGRIHLKSGECESLGKLGLADAFNVHGKIGIDDDGWFYGSTGYVKRFIAFNIHTKEHRLLDEPWVPRMKSGDGRQKNGGQKKGKTQETKEARPDYGKDYEVFRWQNAAKKRPSDGRHVFRYRKKGDKEWRDVSFPITNVTRDIGTLGLGPDGKIYGCTAYHSFRYDPASGKTERFTFSYNVYAYLSVGPILYMQGYPNCRLVALDTRQALNLKTVWTVHSLEQANPWQVANYSDVPPKKGAKEALWLKRGRQLAVGFDGRIFTAGTGERYMSGGKIAWTDPKTMVTDSLGGPFEFLPVSALKSIQGGKKLAGGTWLMRHHGKKVPQPFEATILQFDVATNKLDFMVPLSSCNVVRDILPISDTLWIGLALRKGVFFDGDPLVNTRSVVFFFDAEKRRVTTQIDMPFSLAQRVGNALIRAPDGSVWAAANLGISRLWLLDSENFRDDFGGVVRIDPHEQTITPLFRIPTPGNFIIMEKKMYLCGAPGLRMIELAPFLK
ncbi:MAG: hypothetical protein QGF00_13635 [Planctomycetota bacterium]|nr:hypothetical protein [Planctomycetota bacterium]